ncbi:hypothetical protein LH128_25558 [Sphingomonas sp. LH128]|uniref:hypothetical protein n=1 Tax=Sphingomonas sp. LH128 TaxID=473781 RepID=UPI00027C9CC4|nr:hypothetical protein [Sphingomonas sp. LH128]EJU10116.1 hypothetical protein LH128_25558 [Sphingomonas sp. LH128]
MRSGTIWAVSCALAAGGCTTHLEVAKVNDDASVAERTGVPYMLQFTQYKVVVATRVASCIGSELKTATSAVITPELVDDGDHVYVVDMRSLAAPTKISSMTLTWSEGRLTSINAASEDRTAQIISASVQGIAKIARTVVTGMVSTANMPKPKCLEATSQAVRERDRLKGVVEKLTATIAEQTMTVERLKAQTAIVSQDRVLNRRLASAIALLEGNKLILATEQKALDAKLKFLSYEETYRWPERSTEFASPADKPFTVPASAILKWFEVPRGTPGEETDAEYKVRKDGVINQLAGKMNVFFRLERVGSYGLTASAPESAARRDGFRYRVPASGVMLVCAKPQCARADAVAESTGAIAQLGRIFYLPYKSPPFSNGTFEATFDEQGRLTKAGVANKSASAETIATLGKDLSDTVSATYAAIHKTPAEKAAEELSFYETQKKLADAKAALVVSPTKALLDQVAVLEAQKKVNDLERALLQDPNEAKKEAQAAFEADASLARAELAQLQAAAALQQAKTPVAP